MTRTIASRRQRGGTGRFVGRAREQELLRATLRQLTALSDRSDEELVDDDLTYAQVFLVAAEGGMGKTTLLRRFQEIINENKEQAGATALYLDCERHTLIADTDRLMGVLYDALCEAGFEHEMQPYRDALEQRAEARRKAADAEERYKSMEYPGGRAAGGSFEREQDGLREFIAKKLAPDELKLYDDPEAVTEGFMQALNRIGMRGRPLVLLLDTYELAEGCDNWLRKRAIPLSGPHLVWVIAGRAGQPFVRRYEDEFGTDLVAGILLDTFARPDIAAYLRQWGIPEPSDELLDQLQALSRGVPLALEGWVNLYQQDVALPPADPTTSMTRREIVRRVTERFLRYCNEDDKHLPDEQRRLRDETRFRVLTLILPRRTDSHALAAAWQCSAEQAEEQVNALADQFSFVFAQEIEREPHPLVKEFLREYLRDQARMPVVIESAVTRMVQYFELRLRERERELSPDTIPVSAAPDDRRIALSAQREAHRRRLEQLDLQLAEYGLAAPPHIRTDRDDAARAINEIDARLAVPSSEVTATSGPRRPLWRDQEWPELLFDLLNALCWADQSGERVLRRLVPLFVEALEFTPIRSGGLLIAIEEFVGQWTQDRRRLFEILAAGHLVIASDRKKGDKARAVLDVLQPAADQWRLTSLQRAILDLQRGRLLLSLDSGDKSENLALALATADVAARKLPDDGGELAEALASLYEDVGIAYLWPKRYQTVASAEARHALKNATEFAPKKQFSWYALGISYLKLKQYDTAITALQQAITLDPTDATPHHGLGYLYRDRKQYEKAINAFQEAIALDPSLAYPYSGLGTMYSVLNRIDEARIAYQRAIHLDPQDYESLFCLARIERLAGNQAQSKVLLDQARALLPADDFYNFACLESIAGNADAAIEALRIALERGSDVEWARDDPDFVFIRADPRYRALVGLEPIMVDDPPGIE